MSTKCAELTGHPMDHGWRPHEPQTWKYRFASLRHPLVAQRWNQRKPGLPEYTDVPLAAGQRVKIVMVSRMGDVGITEDITAENGYIARVDLESLCDFGVTE
jgi:hypothetical protein